MEAYEEFVTGSAQEIEEVQKELHFMQDQLSKEQRITETLENEKRLNGEELDRLGEDYK